MLSWPNKVGRNWDVRTWSNLSKNWPQQEVIRWRKVHSCWRDLVKAIYAAWGWEVATEHNSSIYLDHSCTLQETNEFPPSVSPITPPRKWQLVTTWIPVPLKVCWPWDNNNNYYYYYYYCCCCYYYYYHYYCYCFMVLNIR